MRVSFIVIALTVSLLQSGLCADVMPFSYEEKLLIIINSYRIENNLTPLRGDIELNEIAKSHSDYMSAKNILNHDFFNDRFDKSKRQLCVENIGWNAETPEDQFRLWKESGPHNANMLNGKIRAAGISKTDAYVTFFACY